MTLIGWDEGTGRPLCVIRFNGDEYLQVVGYRSGRVKLAHVIGSQYQSAGDIIELSLPRPAVESLRNALSTALEEARPRGGDLG